MYAIVDIDFWEWDAFLVVGEDKFWFNFNGIKCPEGPKLKDAISFFENDNFESSKRALAQLQALGLYTKE